MASGLLAQLFSRIRSRVRSRSKDRPRRPAPRVELRLPESEWSKLAPETASEIGIALQHSHAGRHDAAVECLRAFIRRSSDSAIAHAILGAVLTDLGSDDEAQTCFAQARAADSDLVARLYAAGEAEKAAGRHEQAVAAYRLSALLSERDARAAMRLADTLYIVGEQELSLEWVRKAYDARPNDALRVKEAIMRLPPVYRSAAHLQTVRAQYLSALETLSASSLSIANPFRDINFTNFYLAYQGMNERESQAQLGSILARAAPLLNHRPAWIDRVRSGGRLRVGFVSRYLGGHSVGMCYNKLIAGLAARTELDVVAALMTARRAEEAKRLIGPAATIRVLPTHLAGIREALDSLELDILLFTDIGMEPSTYLLAFGRHARAQGVLAGHPLTTGIPTIDFFVSSHANEVPEAGAHYTERLLCLRTLPVAIAPPPVTPVATRASLGLPENRHLYACPLKLQKFHPDFDEALARILETDPDALILLFDDDARTRWGSIVHERLQARLGSNAARVRFLSWMPFGQLLQLLSVSDVALDTFHFGAGTTAYYALATGCPMVTLPAAYLRGRHTLGYYRKIGIADCIAHDATDYVRIAVRIATDRDYQRDLKERIAVKRDQLTAYDDAIDEFAQALLGLEGAFAPSAQI